MSAHTIRLLIVAGARPNFMKIAPIIKAAAAHNANRNGGESRMEWQLVHTGQHYDQKMSEIFFQELGIPAPDVNLEAGSGSHAQQTANIMARFEPVLSAKPTDWVIVVGDVNSTMACTLVAVKLGVKVAHVEAGLRSFDRTMPEEVNRLVTDALADLLLTPSPDANENLRREGVSDARIELVGNVMIDALVTNLERARASRLPSVLGLREKDFAYVTLHRPSNVDNGASLTAIIAELRKLAGRLPVVFAIHPRTRKMCGQFGIDLESRSNFKVLEPIGYHDSLCLTERARLILTDSGGLQEESTYFRTPCLTLRPNTERPITITMGSNQLTNLERLSIDLENLMRREPEFGEVPPLWDGRTSERIITSLIRRSSSRPEPAPVRNAIRIGAVAGARQGL